MIGGDMMKLTAKLPRIGLLLLGACTTAPRRTEPAAVIVLSSGGAFSGGFSETYHADDTVTVTSSGPGQPAAQRTTQSPAETFAAAQGVIAAKGRGVQGRVDPQAPFCPDYGVDTIRADPTIAGIAGFAGVATGCPNPDVTGLMDDIRSAVAAVQ